MRILWQQFISVYIDILCNDDNIWTENLLQIIGGTNLYQSNYGELQTTVKCNLMGVPCTLQFTPNFTNNFCRVLKISIDIILFIFFSV